jgi:hypothetical protein
LENDHEVTNETETSWGNISQGLFTSLIENLGVQGVQFEELISLDADTIRSLGLVSLLLLLLLLLFRKLNFIFFLFVSPSILVSSADSLPWNPFDQTRLWRNFSL